MSTTTHIRIDPSGSISFIYNDSLADLLNQGKALIKRASHVEPTDDGQWDADMSPVNGPRLGPFRLRATALAAEVAWLKRNLNL